jgi:hypothetical protein
VQRTSWILRSGLLVVILSVALATAAGAATTPDTWITTKTKLALLTTEGVSGTAIKVDTVLGRVTLHGKGCGGKDQSRDRRSEDRGREERAQPAPGGGPAAREGDAGVR